LASHSEYKRRANECVRLAGLTDDLTIRDQLLQLAQDWVFAAQRERPQTDDPGMVKHDDDLQNEQYRMLNCNTERTKFTSPWRSDSLPIRV